MSKAEPLSAPGRTRSPSSDSILTPSRDPEKEAKLDVESNTDTTSVGTSEECLEEGNVKRKVTRKQQILVLVTAFSVGFQTAGMNIAFGVFQAHYTSTDASTERLMTSEEARNRAAVATVGSIGGGALVSLLGFLLTPYLKDTWSMRTICFVGTLLLTLGMGTAAASTKYWHLLLTQGFVAGTGSGLLQYPIMTCAPEYFSKRSGKAMGLISAASGLGGLFYSPVIRAMLQHLGTRKTLGILAALDLVICGVASALAQPPREVKNRIRKVIPWTMFKKPIFDLMIMVNLLHTITISNPLSFGPEFSKSLGFSAAQGAVLLAVNSAIAAPSRFAIGHVADKIGHQNALLLGTITTTLACWLFWFVAAKTGQKALWYAFVIVHGLSGGTFSTLWGSVNVFLFGNEAFLASQGVFSIARGIGYLCGSPLAGLIVGQTSSNLVPSEFAGMIGYNGSLLVLCSLCILAVRVLDSQKKGFTWKA